ncbi:MAG TPA: TMEM175 family protein [Lacunisphaera sp.]|jgi:uncharacterized membrane protein|nr:DUF1211 domain-containing protein [Lacunisphaera sp.]HQY05798.1 TMEM175 family protein [Lacunisphaera sp.]
MSRPRPSSWRDRLPGRRHETHFRWRGGEVSRLENLADAAFGFSLTLLVVAQQVPSDFEGLMKVIRGFPAFAASFVLLIIFWNVHYRFFRRYGLEDAFTRVINYGILLLVIFSVYPLKFLFSSWLGGGGGMRSLDELFLVYRIYGVGLAGVWLLFGLLFWHALRQRERLHLNEVEVEYTRLDLASIRINLGTCLVSVLLSYLPVHPWLPGVIYSSLGFTMAWNGVRFGRRIERLIAARRSDEVRPSPA